MSALLMLSIPAPNGIHLGICKANEPRQVFETPFEDLAFRQVSGKMLPGMSASEPVLNSSFLFMCTL